jgi:hypothetical protein
MEHSDFEQLMVAHLTASVVQWAEFLAADPEVLGSIPGATMFRIAVGL